MNNKINQKNEDFFNQFKLQKYKKGELLIRADEDPLGIFYLKEGLVREYVITEKGEELVINVFKANSFFPMSWAINGTKNDYFFEAMNPVEAWRAPREDVITFIKNNPDILYDLVSRVFKGVDGVLARMIYLMSANARTRLIAELIIYAKRFAKKENRIELMISEREVATFTGMTRETVSREMRKLKEEGFIINYRNKLIITDIRKLENLIRED